MCGSGGSRGGLGGSFEPPLSQDHSFFFMGNFKKKSGKIINQRTSGPVNAHLIS